MLCTTRGLQHSQEVLAAGALNVSALLLDATGELPPQWWRCVGVDMAVLEAVGHELMDLYEPALPSGGISVASEGPVVLYRRKAS